MAIALDTTVAGGTSNTWSHTCTGSNLVLIVMCQDLDDAQGTCTYNGVSMIKLLDAHVTSGRTDVFYLLNPSTGAHNVVVTSASTQPIGFSASYTGVAQIGFPDASADNYNGGGSTSLSASPTVVASNCWLWGFGQTNGVVPTSNLTSRQTGNTASTGYIMVDSNGTVPTGTNTLTVTRVSGVVQDAYVLSMAPATSTNTGNFFTIF